MKQDKHFEYKSETVLVNSPVVLKNYDKVRQLIEIASSPADLTETIVYVSEAKLTLKKVETIVLNAIKNAQTQIKEHKDLLNNLEMSIKDKTINTYQEHEYVKVNAKTGELVTHKVNNLPEKIFIYTKEKIHQSIDYAKMLSDYQEKRSKSKYAKYIDLIPTLDKDLIQRDYEGGKKFPIIETVVPAKIGVQWKSVNTNKDTLLERK